MMPVHELGEVHAVRRFPDALALFAQHATAYMILRSSEAHPVRRASQDHSDDLTEAIMPANRPELAALEHFLAETAVPIFYDLDSDKAEARGTGTLLDLGDRLLLVTAAHVMEGRDIMKFSSPWNRNTGAGATWGDAGLLLPRSSDTHDVAIVELQYPATVEAFRKNYRCLTLDRIGMPTLGATHVLAGFPAELTKASGERVDQQPFAYFSAMLPEPPGDAKNLNPAWDLFFALEGDGEMLSGEPCETPDLEGASGCMIWELSACDGPLWTPQAALKAIGVQCSAKRNAWFRASNWLAVVPLITHFDRRAGTKLTVSLLASADTE
jgi:hypothetical protein